MSSQTNKPNEVYPDQRGGNYIFCCMCEKLQSRHTKNEIEKCDEEFQDWIKSGNALNVVGTKINCNLCNMFFLSTDDLLYRRLERHEEWHEKCCYMGASKNMVKGKVKWRYE